MRLKLIASPTLTYRATGKAFLKGTVVFAALVRLPGWFGGG